MGTRYSGTEAEKRALNCFISLLRASASVSSRVHKELPKHGLTVGQFGVLDALYHLGPLRPNVLASKLLNSGGNVTMIVDNLQKRGFVRRIREKTDRRCQLIQLTPEGENFFGRIFPQQAAQILEEMNRLSTEELETLRALCKKLGAASSAPESGVAPKKV